MESKVMEYKREYTEDIRYAVIAFANTDGGEILIGVEDSGEVCGVSDPDGTLLRLGNMLRDAIRPDVTLFTEGTIKEMEGKAVVSVSVQRGTARPYYLAGKGIRPEGVYIRQGSASVPASETAILQMIRETSGDKYEEARSQNQQLTFEKTAVFFEKAGVSCGEAQMRTLGFIGRDGMYTNLAMLLSEQCVHTAKLAVFEGSSKTVFRDRRELSGSLLDQLEMAFSYIDQFNRLRAEVVGLERVESRDYPPEALREALLNAFVHRDYGISGPTLISIFDDRIEIVSIGGLVRGISYEDIMLGISVLRNERLANVFYRLRLIEAYGTGLLKINECYADAAVKPKIEISDHAFRITLPNRNHLQPETKETKRPAENRPVRSYNERVEYVLRMLSSGSISRRDVEQALAMSQRAAGNLLKKMVEEGLAERDGNGNQSRYRKAAGERRN